MAEQLNQICVHLGTEKQKPTLEGDDAESGVVSRAGRPAPILRMVDKCGNALAGGGNSLGRSCDRARGVGFEKIGPRADRRRVALTTGRLVTGRKVHAVRKPIDQRFAGINSLVGVDGRLRVSRSVQYDVKRNLTGRTCSSV
jgi:hypothetical protein